jgi:hypothetical protein
MRVQGTREVQQPSGIAKKSESVSRPNDHQMITGSGATALALSLIL